MVFCHEWVRLTNDIVEYIRLKDDLSETVAETIQMFCGADVYTVGPAIWDSGTRAGLWRQPAEPDFIDNGGYGMLFETLDGNLSWCFALKQRRRGVLDSSMTPPPPATWRPAAHASGRILPPGILNTS